MKKERKSLSMDSLIECVGTEFANIKDPQKRSKFSIKDCLLSGLGMFYLKMPSMLQFEKGIADKKNILVQNLITLYGISAVPSDTHFRARLDNIEPEKRFQYSFDALISKMQRGKVLEDFRYYEDYFLVAIDGTGYFSSNEIHCENCCIKEYKDGSVNYYHQALAAVMVCPGIKEVLPLGIEPIIKQDGAIKNDCEINAAKRLLQTIKTSHPNLKIILVMDALYANAPLIKLMQELDFRYIITGKGLTHLYEEFKLDAKVIKHEINSSVLEQKYKFANDLELNATNPDVKVNYVEYNELIHKKIFKVREMISEPTNDRFPRRTDAVVYNNEVYFKHTDSGQLTKLKLVNFDEDVNLRNVKKYLNKIDDNSITSQGLGSPAKKFFSSWITDLKLSKENIANIVISGRSRWNIENETFNTLKNLGYNFEHNFGHGYKNLSVVLCHLMFIAFAIDQIQAYCGYYFKQALKTVSAKKYIWERIRVVFTSFAVSSWDNLYGTVINLYDGKILISLTAPPIS
jgi:hypothetical protein